MLPLSLVITSLLSAGDPGAETICLGYFKSIDQSMKKIILYGTPLSLYTGRARSYLIKAGLAYEERNASSEHYMRVVLPAAGGRQSIPVIETESGEVIRDGAAIIDHYEGKTNHGFSPTGIKQRVINRLFDVIGAEGFMRPAMHYRWNYPELNHTLLKFHFSALLPEHVDRDVMSDKLMDRMRNAGISFGATAENADLVESVYEAFLSKLNAHLAEHPYLLGGKPSIADFGMIAPLYAHLGRDPAPLQLMQQKAIRVLRWVERMNRPEPDVGEFGEVEAEYFPDDSIPQTLVDLLQQIAVDFVPETLAAAATINEWLAEQPMLADGETAQRGVGMATFDIEGRTISALAQPYRFYLLQRVQAEFDAASDADQAEIKQLLASCNMLPVLDARLTRSIGRKDNLEVWC